MLFTRAPFLPQARRAVPALGMMCLTEQCCPTCKVGKCCYHLSEDYCRVDVGGTVI